MSNHDNTAHKASLFTRIANVTSQLAERARLALKRGDTDTDVPDLAQKRRRPRGRHPNGNNGRTKRA